MLKKRELLIIKIIVVLLFLYAIVHIYYLDIIKILIPIIIATIILLVAMKIHSRK